MTSEPSTQNPRSLLRGRTARITRGRSDVIDVLATDRRHRTAEQILDAVSQRHSNVHRGSIYRILDTLTSNGVLHHVHLPAHAGVYQLATATHHAHLYCLTCKVVTDLPIDVTRRVARDLDQSFEFALDATRVPLTGYCAQCRPTPCEREP